MPFVTIPREYVPAYSQSLVDYKNAADELIAGLNKVIELNGGIPKEKWEMIDELQKQRRRQHDRVMEYVNRFSAS